MKANIQLGLRQQITMTPQLQQAIRLLQLSTLDLQLEVQQVLETNFMLESAEYEDDADSNTEEQEEDLEKDNEELDDIPEELAIDTTWDEVYGSIPNTQHTADDNSDFLNNQTEIEKTLKSHLIWQLELSPFSDIDRIIATIIIDGINSDGYLNISIEDIIHAVKNLNNQIDISVDDVEVVLRRIQHFDPVGVGARDLSECLLLQLTEYDESTLWLAEARDLLKNYLKLLASRDYAQLARCLKVKQDDLKEIVSLIQSLNPRPGSTIESHHADYIVPDVFVKKIKGSWVVELNQDVIPKVRVNAHYQSLIPQATSKRDVSSLKKHLQEARWFIKSLKSRHDTLLRVSQCIVERQSAFLDYGEEAMRPLVLHDVADELGVHESTISRVTTQKYLHTPRGIFELKYFFSSRITTQNGRDCSSTAIRALIKKLIAAENVAKPLSDDKIAKVLSEQGINVARRTVAKYRESMVIPSSNERKRLT